MKENIAENQDVAVEEQPTQEQNETLNDTANADNLSEDQEANEQPADNVSEGEQAEAKMSDEQVDWRDKYLRLQAEFDNYRKRTLKEKMEILSSAGMDTVKSFLPIVDDMHRAVDAMQKSDDLDALRAGVELIHNKLGETLKSCGVEEIEAVDMPLDVDLHEAVAKFAAGEEKSGKVIDVVERGYKMGDKIVRFAKVVVGE